MTSRRMPWIQMLRLRLKLEIEPRKSASSTATNEELIGCSWITLPFLKRTQKMYFHNMNAFQVWGKTGSTIYAQLLERIMKTTNLGLRFSLLFQVGTFAYLPIECASSSGSTEDSEPQQQLNISQGHTIFQLADEDVVFIANDWPILPSFRAT
ncbi:hypothetical protein QQP08_003398 [Theobroma cacao]|nr:hypothetical protein QQP08_003398 [Theobroma cacao]